MSAIHRDEPIGATQFDPRAFRQALGQFATGVAIVTTPGDGKRAIGVTINSFNSVSIDPPLVLFSIARAAYSLDALLTATGYAINVLSQRQRWISDQFARAQADKWSRVDHEIGELGAPLIKGALAHFECLPHANYEGGDHIIFVGKVRRFSSVSGQPLVFFRGSYRELTDEEHAPIWPLPMHY